MILLVLVALLWVAVLAPSIWRRFSERQGVGSIDHFHHQLQLLEHAGPKTVSPAYRLHTALPHAAMAEEAVLPSVSSARPKLVLLRPTDDVASADVDDGQGGHYERVQVLDPPEPVCVPDMDVDLRAARRAQARRRCTMLLRCLGGVALSTGLIGLLPGMHLVWVVTVLAGVGLAGLLGLMAYAARIEFEQDAAHGRHAAHGARASGASASAGAHRRVEPLDEGPAQELVEVLRPAAGGGSWRRGRHAAESWDDVWEGDADDFDLPRVATR